MGAISTQLASRFRKAKRQLGALRRQAAADFARVPRDVLGVEALIRSGRDPLHAAYVSAQNLTSFFAESVSQFPEFAPYCRIVAPAEEEYLPSGPPMSPLTASYFTTWAFFDVRFGPDGETIGTCLLDVADLVELDPFMVETIRRMQNSRMGIYEWSGTANARVRLKELLTDQPFTCHVASGYRGQAGELWYVRLCPPLLDLADYHVAFTTPYLLTEFRKADWSAYLNKCLPKSGAGEAKKAALHEFLKFGKAAYSRKPHESWSEFVFQAYSRHQGNVIILTGLPDVKDSLPHAP
jgi:hypothetical protein